MHGHLHPPAPVFEGVRDKLANDQPEWRDVVGRKREGIDVQLQRTGVRHVQRHPPHVAQETVEVLRRIRHDDRAAGIEPMVDGCDRHDPLGSLVNLLPGFRAAQRPSLHDQDVLHELQGVLHAVMDLLHEQVFLLEQHMVLGKQCFLLAKELRPCVLPVLQLDRDG